VTAICSMAIKSGKGGGLRRQARWRTREPNMFASALRIYLGGKALAAGCYDYVTKPYSPGALLAKVREFLP
jgi:DNA-binding response OmpR family regulator